MRHDRQVNLSAPVLVLQSDLPQVAGHTAEYLAPFPNNNLFASAVDNSRSVCLDLTGGKYIKPMVTLPHAPLPFDDFLCLFQIK
jgi:hypothetical protein